jgi:hypothetical protein
MSEEVSQRSKGKTQKLILILFIVLKLSKLAIFASFDNLYVF